MTDLNNFQAKVLSQWGQDGVLDKIFDTIGVTNRFFVEFGSSGTDDGQGNTAQLRKRGFDGLLMDGSEHPYGQGSVGTQLLTQKAALLPVGTEGSNLEHLRCSEDEFGNHCVKRDYDVKIEFIKASNINSLFDKYNVPNEFDLLSIDVDGQDFHIWNALDVKYSPRVITIEMNFMIEPSN